MELSPVSALLAVLLLVVFYRRYRRSFGRQHLRPGRLVFVVGFMSLIALAMLIFARTPNVYKLAGAAVGVVLGLVALRMTRFESGPDGWFYVPNSKIGLLVLGLFVGRMVYRLLGVSHLLNAADAASAAAAHPPLVATPLTMFLLFVLLGYYVVYYGGVMWTGRLKGARSLEPLPAIRPRLR